MVERRAFVFRVRISRILVFMFFFLLVSSMTHSVTEAIGEATPDDYKAICWLEFDAGGDGYLHFKRSDADPCDASLNAPGVDPEAILLKGDDGCLYAWSQWEGMGRLTRLLPAEELDTALVTDAAATAAPMVKDGALYYLAETEDGSRVRTVDIGADEAPAAHADGAPAAEVFVSPDRPDSIRIAFSGPMDRESVERGLWLSMGGAEIPSCKVWIGNSLYLIPEWSVMASAISAYDGDWTLSIDGAMDAEGRLLSGADGAAGLSEMVRLSPPELLDGRRLRRVAPPDLALLAETLLGLAGLTNDDFLPSNDGYQMTFSNGLTLAALPSSWGDGWYMAVSVANPADFYNSEAAGRYAGLADIIPQDMLTLVAGEADGTVLMSDLPDAVKTELAIFAADGEVAVGSGIRFFGHVPADQGVMGAAADLIIGRDVPAGGLPVSGAVPFDMVEKIFDYHNQDYATPAQAPSDAISLTIALPDATPVPFDATNNKEAVHMEFSEIGLTIGHDPADGFHISGSRKVGLWLLNNSWLNDTGAPVVIDNGLTVRFDENGLTEIESGGSVDVSWEDVFGIDWLDLDSFSLDGVLEPQADSVSAGLTLSAQVNVNGSNATVAFGFSMKDGAFDEISFGLAGIDLSAMPGIQDIPGIENIGIDELAVGFSPATQDAYFKGRTHWRQPEGVAAELAILKTSAGGETSFCLFMRVLNLTMGALIPDIPAPLNDLSLPEGMLALSSGDLTNVKLGDLPEKVRTLFDGILANAEDALPFSSGVALAAGIDLNGLKGDMRLAAEKLGLIDPNKDVLAGMGLEGPLVLIGAVGGVFEGAPSLDLSLGLPKITMPEALQNGVLKEVVQFQSTTGSLFLSVSTELVLRFGLRGELNVGMPRLVPGPGDEDAVDDLTLAGAVYVDLSAVGAGARVSGAMEGEWNEPLGLKKFSAADLLVMGGADVEGAFEFGFEGAISFQTGPDEELSYKGSFLLNLILTTGVPVPKKFAFNLEADKLGYVTKMRITEALLSGVIQGSMGAVVLEVLPEGSAEREAFLEIQKQLGEKSLLDMFLLDRIAFPLIQYENVVFYFATPGADMQGSNQLDGMGVRVAGGLHVTVMSNEFSLAEIDNALTLKDGLKLYGAIGDIELGPVGLTNAELDIAAGIPHIHGENLPRFIIRGNTRLLFYNGAVDIELSPDTARFLMSGDWGAFGNVKLDAETIGASLLTASDFVVSLEAAMDIEKGLREEILKFGDQFIEKLRKPYETVFASIDALESELRGVEENIEKIKQEAWDAMQSIVGPLADKIRGWTRKIRDLQDEADSIPIFGSLLSDILGEIAGLEDLIDDAEDAIDEAQDEYNAAISADNPVLKPLFEAKDLILDQLNPLRSIVAEVERATFDAQGKLIRFKMPFIPILNDKMLTINRIAMDSFSLKDALTDPDKKTNLYLDLTFNEEDIRKTVSFTIASPENIFDFMRSIVFDWLRGDSGNSLGESFDLPEDVETDQFVEDYVGAERQGRVDMLSEHLNLPEDEEARIVADFVNQDEVTQLRELSRILLTSATQTSPPQETAPENDAFADANILSGDQGEVLGSNAGATAEAGEPAHADAAASASVWWKWIAPGDGQVVLDAGESDFETLLAVYTGSELTSLETVAAGEGKASFEASAGTLYHFAVDGGDGAQGRIELSWWLYPPEPPENDKLADAIALEGEEGVALGANKNATAEAGEPAHGDADAEASVWWSWTAPADGAAAMDVSDSRFQALLAVYTGDDLAGLEKVAAGNAGDAPGRVNFEAAAGTTYRIAVDGVGGDQGAIRLEWSLDTRTPPANDAFADVIALDGENGWAMGLNRYATAQEGEPAHAGEEPGASVWWTWTAPSDGEATWEVASEDFEAALTIYTGDALADLVPVAATGEEGKAVFDVSAGAAYRLAVDSRNEATGTLELFWNLDIPVPPLNDEFAGAVVIPADAATVSGDNVDAVAAEGEPSPVSRDAEGTVWWRFTAPADGGVVIDTEGSQFDTLLAVYAGETPEALHPVAENDDASTIGGGMLDNGASRVRFRAEQGEAYYIAVASKSDARGDIQLNIGSFEYGDPPPNDDLVDRTPIPEGVWVINGATRYATLEEWEPRHAGVPGQGSVWYSWTAPSDGALEIDTRNSGFDTVLAVYTATILGDLRLVAENEDQPSSDAAKVTFEATKGTTYQIAADGENGAWGNLTLNLDFAERPVPPENDNIADAIALEREEGWTRGSNQYATAEEAEPAHAGDAPRASVWWEWTAPADGKATWEVASDDFDAALAVYTGEVMEELTPVAAAAAAEEEAVFEVSAGAAYRIAVDSRNDATGAYTLNWSLYIPDPPANDDFAGAVEIPADADAAAGTNVDAAAGEGEPTPVSEAAKGTVWWRLKAPADGDIVIDTEGSVFDTLLAVYAGDTPEALELVAENDDGPAADGASMENGASQVRFTGEEDETYFIAVASKSDARGDIRLNIGYVPPPNDDFADRKSIPEDVWSVNGGTQYATLQEGEPRHAGVEGHGSVWYSWTAVSDGDLVIDTRGSDFDTVIAVYTGTGLGDLTLVAENEDMPLSDMASVTFEVEKGKTYQIAVDGERGASGDLTLDLQFSEKHKNDDSFCFVSAAGGHGRGTATGAVLFLVAMLMGSALACGARKGWRRWSIRSFESGPGRAVRPGRHNNRTAARNGKKAGPRQCVSLYVDSYKRSIRRHQ